MTRRRMSGPERREQLIGVGRAVFAERGYAATTVEEIADRSGVSKPVVYEHFGGKEGLYAVIVDREVTDLTERMAEAMQADGARQAGEQAAMAFLGYIEDNADGFRILAHDAPAGIGSGSLASVMDDVAGRVEKLLLKQFRGRGFDRRTAPMYARMLVGAVTLVGEWWLDVGEPDREQVAAHVVNLMWFGLRGLQPQPDLATIRAEPESPES